MSELTLRGRGLSKYIGHGEALLSMEPISFFGGVNPKTGIVVERSHPLENISIKGKVLIFPYGKGSTVGAYVLYQMSKLGTAPAAIINVKATNALSAILFSPVFENNNPFFSRKYKNKNAAILLFPSEKE